MAHIRTFRIASRYGNHTLAEGCLFSNGEMATAVLVPDFPASAALAAAAAAALRTHSRFTRATIYVNYPPAPGGSAHDQ